MNRLISLLPLAALAGLTAGCAMAQAPKPIEDVEPEVTREVAAAIAKQGADPAADGATLVRACPAAPPLELLKRSVDGEERTYVYRARCGNTLLVTATYGKSRAIKRLLVKPE
jgi:hypothetical protein